MQKKKFAVFLSLFSMFSFPLHGQNLPLRHSPVLIELFTSQGCSSCPPAEDFLDSYGMDMFQKGQILPLAFHVDYWNYLGWTDPFSSPDFTDRQRKYTGSLRSSLYTPQMVVAGRIGFVGSDSQKARLEVARHSTAADISHFWIGLKAVPSAQGMVLEVALSPADKEINMPLNRLWIAVFENSLVTRVEKGENAGRVLKENFVVRQLKELKTPSINKDLTLKTNLPWNAKWDKTSSGIAVFLQDSKTLEINGVKWIYPLR